MINNRKILGENIIQDILVNKWQIYNVQDYNLNPILLCNLDSFFSCFGVPALILLVVHNTKQDTLTFISACKSSLCWSSTYFKPMTSYIIAPTMSSHYVTWRWNIEIQGHQLSAWLVCHWADVCTPCNNTFNLWEAKLDISLKTRHPFYSTKSKEVCASFIEVGWENRHHFHICLVNIKLQATAS